MCVDECTIYIYILCREKEKKLNSCLCLLERIVGSLFEKFNYIIIIIIIQYKFIFKDYNLCNFCCC